jgi:uncharacterized circularly permuted ATP-grasp superfamily protein
MGPRTLHHNKAFERDGAPRAFYRPLLEAMEDLGPEAFAGRRARAGEILGELGATFPLPGATGEGDRILPADWVPRIIPRDDWEELSYGLLQRGWAINAWLADLYHGDQRVVPNEVVESSVFYTPGRLPAHSAAAPVHVYGPDVVRLDSGEYVVLEDNVRVPSGVAYAEAIRRAGLNALEELFAPYRVNGVYAYYAVLRATLEAAAPPGVDIPSIMIVTGGPEDPAFFEHSHISEACGIRLVTLGDLRVSGGAVLAEPDGQRIDVIYRRVEGGYVVADLPELEETYRRGGVNLANALGVGVADDKAVFPYVPAMIEHYLGEEQPCPCGSPTCGRRSWTFSPSWS